MASVSLAPRGVIARRRGDEWLLSSPLALDPPPPTLGYLLRRGASRAPARDFLLEREGAAIRRVTWGGALAAAEGVASWLVRANPERRPVLALSGASVDHALVMLGCFLAGVPFVPVSPAYSLLSKDLTKLRRIVEKVRSAVVYVEARAPFAAAVDACGRGVTLVTGGATPDADALHARDLFATPMTEDAAAREREVGPDDVAKILFTSGSTASRRASPTRTACSRRTSR